MKNVEMTVEGTTLTIKVDLIQRVRTLCFGEDDHHCLDGGECDHSKPRGEGRAERVPEEVTGASPRNEIRRNSLGHESLLLNGDGRRNCV